MANLLIRHGRPAEIMLIEDNRSDAVLASRAFEAAQIENNLTIADSGEAAMAMLRREGVYAGQPTPDIILLDLNLPRMTGRDVLSAIKDDENLKAIPVIVLSGSDDECDIAACYERHASAYIVKPVDLKKFRNVVTTIEQFFFMVVVLPAVHAAEVGS